jgi:hypothetical protein
VLLLLLLLLLLMMMMMMMLMTMSMMMTHDPAPSSHGRRPVASDDDDDDDDAPGPATSRAGAKRPRKADKARAGPSDKMRPTDKGGDPRGDDKGSHAFDDKAFDDEDKDDDDDADSSSKAKRPPAKGKKRKAADRSSDDKIDKPRANDGRVQGINPGVVLTIRSGDFAGFTIKVVRRIKKALTREVAGPIIEDYRADG